jgi:chromosome segregation ATPase
MSENRLGDYLNPEDDPAFEDNGAGIGGSIFQQEANTLKIEKLSQRVTIISVIIPCIIIAILAFVYLDITEKVVDVDQTQADHMAKVSQDLDIKLNALDVRIAKATHELDEKLTTLESKRQALENQTAKMSAAKVDLKAMEAALAKLDKRIKANADQDKSTLAATERINQQLLAAIDKNNSDVKAVSGQIKKEFRLFKEEFDARLLELSAYEQRIVQLTKDTNRLGKQLDKLKQDTAASMDKKVGLLKQDLEKCIAEVKRRADAAHLTAKKAAADAAKPLPQAQSTASPQASSSPVSPTPTPKVQAPDVPTRKVPGTGGISVQDLSQ